MADVEDKENLAPLESSGPPQSKSGTPSPKRAGRKGRSKSIGPGGLDEPEGLKQDAKHDAKNRRKSTYIPATKSIISNDIEKAERQAARRKTLANRRVSFAPEATLHTWDVVEFMRDPTTSTESSDNTRRTSRSGGGTPFKRAKDMDSDPPSTPDEECDAKELLTSPANQVSGQKKQRRRSSGIPPMNFNNPDDMSSVISGSSDVSDSEEDAEGSDDDTGTAMSLDVDNNTVQSIDESESGSTDSSGRLEANLRQAAQTAGTRGIEFDEYGDDVSMELAGDEVTNAFQSFVEQRAANQPVGSASMDQENVNPFSPAFKAQLISGAVSRPSTVAEEDTGEMSMDITRAVGSIVTEPAPETASSPLGDGTMELTQAVGKIQQRRQSDSPQNRSGQKRRRSTTEAGSPGASISVSQSKRRRSSIARSSMGDDTMDLTSAVGGIQSTGSLAKIERRRSTPKRLSSGSVSDREEATMDFTQAVGGIKPAGRVENTASSFDENEELTMELTTVLGDIKASDKAAKRSSPVTPNNQSPKDILNTTPKDQERFKDAPDSGPKKLLTPIFQKQLLLSAEKNSSGAKSSKSTSPAVRSHRGIAFVQPDENEGQYQERMPSTPLASPAKEALLEMSSLGGQNSPLRATPSKSPSHGQSGATPDTTLQQQLDLQLQPSEPEPELSPSIQKQQRSSPVKAPSTPEVVNEPTLDGRRLAESIKMMSTPRKETLKSVTSTKQAPAVQQSPQTAPSSKTRAAAKARTNSQASPERQLGEDLQRIQSSGDSVKTIQLQEFLETAGIRFMDLSTTKRRITTATTPSKARTAGELLDGPEEDEVNLENAIVAGGCKVPELEMYEHACHELKRYISDGKKIIKELEVETSKGKPPLIHAYMAAAPKRRAAIDAQMRDIKTHARYRSKEMWYAWRAQLLDDLMKALQGIGEGLIKDDETLQHAKEILDQVLPGLAEQHDNLQSAAEKLEQEAATTNEDEKEKLDSARERLQAVDYELAEKQKLLEQLQKETNEQDTLITDLEESKEEFAAAIQEADRVKESCRGVSISEITSLKASIEDIKQTTGWAITSASSSPPTVTMTYKSQLQLYFHPYAFQADQPNAPISLTYTAPQVPRTTLRFFLQLLRASLQALRQSETRVSSLLSLVSKGWETALSLAEAERRLDLEAPTEPRIVSDERLVITSTLLLPKVRTKVRVDFEIVAAVGEGEDLELSTSAEPSVRVVYGEQYNEPKMTEFLEREMGSSFEGWHSALRGLRERLVARGAKGTRK